MKFRLRFLAFSLFVVFVRATSAADATGLVYVVEGTLPIILSAPHGGVAAIPGAAIRTNDNTKNFTLAGDVGTDALAEKLAAAVEKKLGGKPYVVIARFSRKFADANRPAADAFEAEGAKADYVAYHAALSNACRAVHAKWGRGLLLDLHGQGAQSNAIFRGTSNRRTVAELVKNFGEPALSGPQSIFGNLAGRGIVVIPAPGEMRGEDARYNGGFIVRTYGSHKEGGVDALQLEFGSTFRRKQNLDRTAAELAEAVAAFAKAYLPPPR